MIKKKIAEKIYGLLNVFSDYIESGFNKNSFIPDFSIFEQKKREESDIVVKNNTAGISKKRQIIEVGEEINECNKCLYNGDVKKVYGVGNINAEIAVITLPPTDEEISIGKPMSNEAALFFKKWLSAISLELKDVFITNIDKCPPKEKLTKNDIENCLKTIDKELAIIEPKIILSLGQLTASSLRKEYTNLTKSHGSLFLYKNIPVIPTYHPAEVLKKIELKKAVWDDLKKLKNKLEDIL